MKNKKHYLSLFTIVTLMVIMVSILSYNNIKKIEVEVLEGSNKVLGDISLVYNPENSALNKRDIVLSKDGLKNNFKIQNPIYRDYIDTDKKYNSFIDWESEENLYENEKYIGKIFFNTSFYGNEDSYIEIKQKDKKTNITKKIKIKLDNKIFGDSYVTPIITNIVDNEIYVAIDQDEIGSLKIMKINLKDKTYKILKNIDLKTSNNEYNVKFLHNNKIYMEIYAHDTKREYTYFIIYDIEKNTITKSNEFMKKIEKQG